MMGAPRLPALVVGGGPAGLAASRSLKQLGIEHVVLERGTGPGTCWANAYDSLRLHTGKHLSALPGMRFPASTPLFPSRTDFLRYLERYAERFALPLQYGHDVQDIEPNGDGWLVRAAGDEWLADNVVIATGLMSNPVIPEIAGRAEFRGRVLHSVEYRRPGELAAARVLVIGVGNSGGEIASELAHAGARVSIAVRSGANVVPLTILGLPSQYIAFLMRSLPRAAKEKILARVRAMTERRRGPPVLPRSAHSPLDAIPLIGFHLDDAIRAGKVQVRGAVERLTAAGARFADGVEEPFDAVILATGFRAALQPLGAGQRVDARGFALRSDRVTCADRPGLYFVGHNYDSTGGLRNIARDAPLAAGAIARRLRRSPRAVR